LRTRIDRIASETTLESVEQEQVNFAGDVMTWLIGHALPGPEEEASHAASVRGQLLEKYRTIPTPEFGERILRRLTDQLPPHLKPDNFGYALTVLDAPEASAFTCGGGPVYITRSLLEAISGVGEQGQAALAFILAHELGHMALLHCRRGWQRIELQEELDHGLQLALAPETLRALTQTGIATVDSLATFLYSRNQQYEADLFALHLCQSAGYPPDVALDGMRYLVTWSHPAIRTQDNYRPDSTKDRSALGYYLSAEPDPLFRLKRLLLEWDGAVEDTRRHGLFVYDRATGASKRCETGSIGAGQRPLILVHGLGGVEDSFAAFLSFLAGCAEVRDRPLLIFRYPNNESLARSGRFLHHEVGRVIGEPRSADFLCHSAGGLVFRYYAEIQRGGFDRAVFLGTPHRGSDLVRLRLLAELAEYARDLMAGLSLPGPDPRREGRGQIVHDLHSDSLFLRHLGHDPALAARYHIFYGRRLDRFQALALRTSFAVAAPLFRERLAGQVPSTCLRRCAQRLLDDQNLPEEVLDGDLAVTVQSACLQGASAVVETALDHQSLKTDEAVLGQVLRVLVGSGENR
jgi:pimeloyl-ACP methyl ester carboxylesterase